MAHTHAHNPWKTTDYYKHNGEHNEHLWQKSKNRIRREKADSQEIRRQNRSRRRADNIILHKVTRTMEDSNNVNFHGSARRDMSTWPSS